MTSRFRNPPSLAKDYYIIGAIFIAIVLLIVLGTGSYIYYYQKSLQTRQLEISANRIETVTKNSFDYVAQIARFTGEKIRDHALHDPQKITEILRSKEATNDVAKTMFSWSMFDWVTANNKLIATGGPLGVLEKPKDVSHRYYAKMAPVEPWKLHFDEPSVGIPSGMFIVPMGMGITDELGKFVGITTAGVDIELFSNSIEREVQKDNVSFMVLSRNYNIVFQSRDNRTKAGQNSFFADLFKANNPLKEPYGKLHQPILFNDITYSYYKKLQDYPYTILVGYDRHFVNKTLYETLFPLIIAFIAMGTICMLLMFFMRRLLFVPIMQLVEAADRIKNGEQIPTPRLRSIELHSLSYQLAQFRKCLNSNKRREIKLKEQAEELALAKDAVERANQNLEEEVRKRTEGLQKAINTREEFLNNMSHEIRMPAGNIMGMAGMLLEDWEELGEDERKVYATEVHDNCRRLYGLLSNLLDLAKAKAGRMSYDMQNHDLVMIAEQVINEAKFTYTSKKLEVIFIKPENSTTITQCDQIRIGQVIRNLLSNAIKFTAEGMLTLTIKPTSLTDIDGRNVPGLAFSLKDEGVGVPPDELADIFDVFKQSTKTKTRAGGTGLGLSVCREIITAHHGVIWVENNESGRGTTFTFVIPKVEDFSI